MEARTDDNLPNPIGWYIKHSALSFTGNSAVKRMNLEFCLRPEHGMVSKDVSEASYLRQARHEDENRS